MPDAKQMKVLMGGVEKWNKWRSDNREIPIDLSCALLDGADLHQANLAECDLTHAFLYDANLRGTQLRAAKLIGTNLCRAHLCGADLRAADLHRANLDRADLSGADLSGANLERAMLVGTKVSKATFANCRVCGVSAWDLDLKNVKDQSNLLITRDDQPERITVDNLEVAQFVYLLLHNEKIRDVINTVTSKAVLILGRFTEKRKPILDSLRKVLKEHKEGYVPILFDFPPSPRRDLTETLQILANMARFVIADLTGARSIPQELSHIIPFLPSVPIQPIILASERKFAMFEHWEKFTSVLSVFAYKDAAHLIANLDANVVNPVARWEKQQDRVRVLKDKVKELEAKLAAVQRGY
jgi:hypothetical protein